MSDRTNFKTITIGDVVAILTIIGAAIGVVVHDQETAQHLADRVEATDHQLTLLEVRVTAQDQTLRQVDVMANDIKWIRSELSARKARPQD